MPDPDKLHQYPPKVIEAMVEMARKEQSFRHDVTFKDQDHKMQFDRRAQYCTLVSYLTLFGLGGACVLMGHPWFGSALVGATFITAIGSAFFNREASSTELEEEPPKERPSLPSGESEKSQGSIDDK